MSALKISIDGDGESNCSGMSKTDCDILKEIMAEITKRHLSYATADDIKTRCDKKFPEWMIGVTVMWPAENSSSFAIPCFGHITFKIEGDWGQPVPLFVTIYKIFPKSVQEKMVREDHVLMGIHHQTSPIRDVVHADLMQEAESMGL